MGPYGWPGDGMGWDGWLAMGFGLLILCTVVAAGMVLVIRSFAHRHAQHLVGAGPMGPTRSCRSALVSWRGRADHDRRPETSGNRNLREKSCASRCH